MLDPIDGTLARRLDGFTVPALPADFTDRMVALAQSEPVPLPKLRPVRPRRWLRGGAIVLGAVSAGMISISAAAMGWLGEPVRQAVVATPVIGTVIARVIAKPVHIATKPRPMPTVAAPSPNAVPVSEPSITPVVPNDSTVSLLPPRMQQRIEAGLPVRPWVRRTIERERMITGQTGQLTPEERAMLRRKMLRRQYRMSERRAMGEAELTAGQGASSPDQAMPPRQLNPELRRAIRQRRMERLRQRYEEMMLP